MKKHIHQWKRTGKCKYSMPGLYENKCECGKVKWIEGDGIPKIILTKEEFKKKFGFDFLEK